MSSGRFNPGATQINAEVQTGRSARPWFSLALISLLALALRLAWLGRKSLWIDEADSLFFASQSFSEIFTRLCDPHPPGYYALLHVFLAVGRSEFWVRLPSAVAGALTVPLFYLLGRELVATFGTRWLDQRTSLLAALLLAVAPLHVWYAQDARMYALATALGLCAACFALRVAARERVRDALGYVLCATAALYVDQSSLLPLLLANLVWAGAWARSRSFNSRSGLRKLGVWIGLQLVAGMAFGVWWSQALFRSTFDADILYPLTMVKLVLQRYGLSVGLADLRWALGVGGAVVLAAGVLGAWLLARHDRFRNLLSILAPAVLVLFLLFTLGSAIPRLFTLKRLLVGLLPFGLLICAIAIRELGLGRWQLTALVGFSLALSAVNLLWAPKEPWREVVSVVQKELGPADTLWVDELAVPAFDYYYDGSHERSVWRAAHLYELEQAGSVNQQGRADERQIWVVALVDPYRNLLDYLPVDWEAAWSADWHRVSVRAYARSSVAASPGVSKPDLPAWLLAWPSPVHEACGSEK